MSCSIVWKLLKNFNSIVMKVAEKIDSFEMLRHLYNAFNERNIDRAFEVIHPDAVWANRMEGGVVKGHQGIREYWTRQWSYMKWRVRPMSLQMADQEPYVVQAHQIIRDLSGIIVSIRDLQHIFQIEDGLIKTM